MLDTICEVLKEAYSRNLITSRDGNASYRRKGENCMYITPSGTRKNVLNSEMMIKLNINTGERVLEEQSQRNNIGLKPSGELTLHLNLQKLHSSNRVVLHLHPTYIIAAMLAGLNLQNLAEEFPEINRYTRVGPTVRSLPPVSEELAKETIKAFNLKDDGSVSYDIIGLDRHGVVSVGKDAWSAFEHIERLEHICKIVLSAKTN